MSDRPDYFTAGDFWHFAEASAEEVGGVDIHGFLAGGIAKARSILLAAGFTEAELVNERPSVLRERVPQGSIEDVALGLMATGMSARASLSIAKPSARMTLIEVGLMEGEKRDVRQAWHAHEFEPNPDHGSWLPERDVEADWCAAWDGRMARAIDAAAAAVADFGARFAILHSMSAGLTRSASDGRAGQRQREEAAKRAAEASRNAAWHEDAVRLWAENPTWTKTKMAKHIAHQHSTESRVVDPRSVGRSIAALVPPTSPSFRGG